MLDGFVLQKVVSELQKLKSEHLRQVYQYGKLIVYLYFETGVVRVCLEAPLQHVCLTEKEDFSDHHPSSFVMMLRSKLRNARLVDVEQYELDRVLIFTFSKVNEIGEKHEYKLFVELFGTHSNLILVESGFVIDCFRQTTAGGRRIAKGEPYCLPNQRFNPLKIGYEAFSDFDCPEKVSTFLQKNFYGFSRILVNEVLSRAGLTDLPISAFSEREKALLKHSFFSVINDFHKSFVCVYSVDNKFVLSAIPLTFSHAHKITCFESPSKTVDDLFRTEIRQQKIKKLSEELTKVVQEMMTKEEKLIESLEKETLECEKKDEYLRFGELLKYASEQDRRGNQVLVFDWNTGEKILVPLVNNKSVRESSQYYFELYKKMKEKLPVLQMRIKQAIEKLDYLRALKIQIETVQDLRKLEEIKEQLSAKREKKATNRFASEKSSFRKFEYEGFKIFVGKNNKQNEELLRSSNDKDIWLHAHEMPGAHVFIKVEDKIPSESVIRFAASLAAYYSGARYSSNVPVDYTEVKNVHKPKGSPPGLVLYTHYSTVFVTPLSVEQIVREFD